MAADALLSQWVQGSRGGGGGWGARMVKSFSHSLARNFPLICFLKQRAGELLFYKWKKAHSPEWKSFPLRRRRKKALDSVKFFPVSETNVFWLWGGNLLWPSKKRSDFVTVQRVQTHRLPEMDKLKNFFCFARKFPMDICNFALKIAS